MFSHRPIDSNNKCSNEMVTVVIPCYEPTPDHGFTHSLFAPRIEGFPRIVYASKEQAKAAISNPELVKQYVSVSVPTSAVDLVEFNQTGQSNLARLKEGQAIILNPTSKKQTALVDYFNALCTHMPTLRRIGMKS